MTPEERAKALIKKIVYNAIYAEAFAAEALAAQAIREAEQAMSKYWEMTVGQERDELKKENAELKKKNADLEEEIENLYGQIKYGREMDQ